VAIKMRTITLAVALLAGYSTASVLAAQDQGARASIERGLQSKYPPTKLSGIGERMRFTQLGTVLVIQQDGMAASPVTEFTFGNNYKDGRIKRSLAGSLIHQANNVRDLRAGDRVYLLKTEVKDTGVVFNVQTCDFCDGSAMDLAQMPYRAALTFQYPKGFWTNTSFAQIQQAISEVFTFADGPSIGMPPNPEQVAPIDAQVAQPPPPPPPPPASQAEPVKIGLGQTTDQVVAGLGQPDKVVDLGGKKIYIYKDLKITFVDGKVSDVQ
jgi:hypothetical protein